VTSLTVLVLVYLGYGLVRFSLGIDFTDEGAYLSWPLRRLFGEPVFSADLVTLCHPVEAFLFVPFRLHPSMTLYEFRLLGWLIHLLAFATLSICLFRLSHAPLQSLLIASVPFFVCNIFGIASPSYNMLSSDFLLVALSLQGYACLGEERQELPLHVASGLALFIATLAHPGLGIVGAGLFAYEVLCHGLARNLANHRLSASNLGILAFIFCWLAFLLYLTSSGALANWLRRLAFVRLSSVGALQAHPARSFFQIAVFPFDYDLHAIAFNLLAFVALWFLQPPSAAAGGGHAGRAAAWLAVLIAGFFILTFSRDPSHLPVCLVPGTLVLLAAQGVGRPSSPPRAEGRLRFLVLMSGLAASAYAALTYFFFPLRSWISGTLGLPFAFAVGLTCLLEVSPRRPASLRSLILTLLAMAVACFARDHYREIYRDAPPPYLSAHFQLPKLRHIRSTPERVQIVEELYEYMHPRIARGEPLLVYDGCPMLYYLFDASPAYGLTWAERYSQSPAILQRLNRDLNAKPLPRYAIRTLVNLSHPVWSKAPLTDYDNYPLNETVTANYVLEQTIFPFEIWRLKTTVGPTEALPGLDPR
jgi:hypothetical protein